MRQFIAESVIDSKGCLIVEGKKFHYLNSVLRVKSGDMIYVRLLDSSLQQMTVAKIDTVSKKIILQIAGSFCQNAESIKAKPILEKSKIEFFLFQFEAKPPKMDLIIRQAVECGISKIIPVEGEFCQKGNIESAKKKSDGKDERWQRIITEAREQSGSATETKVLSSISVSDACTFWNNQSGNKIAIVLYERSDGTKNIQNALENADVVQENTKVALAVGAEGGISPKELEILKQNGFIPVHFETNILRCETASLYGIAALQTVLNGAKNVCSTY